MERIAYGPHPAQFGELTQGDPDRVAVLLHGGFWRAAYDLSLMRDLADDLAARGVQFVKGTDFLLEGGENTLRLAYSGVTADEIDEGVARLGEALRSLD